MYKNISFLVLMATLTLSSCNKQPPSQITTDSGSHPVQGSSVGNGIIAYSNEQMGLFFKYPANWTLREEPHKVQLSNSNIAGDGPISWIEFALHSELDGIHFSKLEELHEYLKEKFPKILWHKTNLTKKEGLWYESTVGSKKSASYYLLDENYNVLVIQLETYKEFDGERVIWAIIKQLTIDAEGPIIQDVFFTPKEARPGDKVKLVVDTHDEASGIDLERVGYETELEYNIPFDPNSEPRTILHNNSLDWIQPPFKKITETKFEAEFELPKYMPIEDIVLFTMYVYDRKGNFTKVQCVRERGSWLGNIIGKLYKEKCHIWNNAHYVDKDVYLNQYHQWLYLPKIHPLKSLDPSYVEDLHGPNFLEAYFGKSKLSKSDKRQRLYIKMRDQSKIHAVRAEILGMEPGGNLGSANSVHWDGPIHVKDDLFYLETDSSPFLRFRLVWLFNIRMEDAVGNISGVDWGWHEQSIRFEIVD